MAKQDIKPATKEEVVKISKEMKEVADNVTRKVNESMKLCESAAEKYASKTKSK